MVRIGGYLGMALAWYGPGACGDYARTFCPRAWQEADAIKCIFREQK